MPTQQEILTAIESLEKHCQTGLELCYALRNTVLGKVTGPATMGAEKPKKDRPKRVGTPAIKDHVVSRLRQRVLQKAG